MKYRILADRLFYFLITIALPCLMTACNKDWLDVKADKRQVVPTSNKDLQAILDNAEFFNANIAECLLLQEISADGHCFSDQMYEGIYPEYGFFKNAYAWSAIHPFEQISAYHLIYLHPYEAILKCNTILQAKQGNNEPNEFKHIRAQALFMRANFHFYLAQTFASAYDPSKADKTPGIPLRTEADITTSLGRSSLQQVYQQVTKDLKEAIPHLPETPGFVTRASKPAALGLLARVYLNMERYEDALHYADEYLKLKNELLDFSSLDPEALYIGLNKEVALMEYINAGPGGLLLLGDAYTVSPELFDLYHPDDLRKTIYFYPATDVVKIKGNYINSADERFVGIATDEIYLIRAESYARLDQISLAMKDLNTLLRTRWARSSDGSDKYVDLTAANETEALQKILLERRKELVLRGLRWADLRRLNKDPRFAVTLKRTIQGKEYTLAPNSPRYTFPFPKEAIERAGFEQNPGW